MHKFTMRTWECISEWQEKTTDFHKATPDIINPLLTLISECVVLNENIKNQYPELHSKFESTFEKMQHYQVECEFWQEIQREYVKDRHLEEIFKLVKPDQVNSKITIKDILELPVKLYSLEIREILFQAKQEYKYQKLIERIKFNASNIKLNVINYKEYFILSEFDLASEQIVDDSISIESALENIESIPFRDEYNEWKQKLSLMKNTIEKVLEAQKTWLSLESTFRNECLKECLHEDFEKFIEYQTIFCNFVKECKEAPNIFFILYEQGKVYGEILERLANNFTLLQKNIEEFIETKRLAFPRLFFLNDTQFIDFLSKLKHQENFDFYIAQLFPGANGFFFKKSMQDIEIPPQIINDISVLHEEEIDVTETVIRNFKTYQENLNIHLSKALKSPSQRNYNYGSKKISLIEVLGMISTTKELFLFEKKVNITEKPEQWLQKVEQSMQETIGKNINYAVSSFPKQSLDEWILDHPQQIILTTIHLILTHEVNELFEEMKRTGKVRKDEGEGEGDEGDSEKEEEPSHYFEENATPKTPNTRDLIKHSKVSSMWEDRKSLNSYRSSLKIIKGREESKNESTEKDGKSYQNREKLSKNFTPGKSIAQVTGRHHENSDVSESKTEHNPEETDDRKKFVANMFGSDFNIDLIIEDDKEDRDDVMRTLQEKSFRGLFLRLQFWINQICKSLHGKTKETELDLPIVHRVVMKTIVCFLNYMRDVVFDLKQKGIDHVDHYEWQKQIRLTWNGRENGCKVDCGAWTTYQGNEYLGSTNRLALTPLTTKYFVFISSAFREKSAVLLRCIPDHAKAEDIFHEFSNVCTTPFKSFDCNKNMSMRHLMQYLNGAALASIWVFFEHIDKLNYINLQTFNKEIQMVQQQFIIAELSQDSSVITAHITVGNHSHSQAQKSIEQRFNPQRVPFNDEGNREDRQQDIKIEDNFNDDANQDNEDDISAEEEIISTHQKQFEENKRMASDREVNLEHERPLDSESGENILNNNKFEEFKGNRHKELLEDILKEENYNTGKSKPSKHGKHSNNEDNESNDYMKDKNKQKYEKSSQAKNGDKTDSNETANEEGAKMNKICFGVFASISHEFILENNKKSEEISNSLQSAFRVISLTRPEYKIILKTLLKCEGIKNYDELGNNIYEFVNSIKSIAPPGATDKQFSFTYQDVQSIVRSVSFITEQNWKDKRVKYLELREASLSNLNEYCKDYRNKSADEDKKNEEENMINSMERNDRTAVECDATIKSLEMYAIQRCLYDWYMLRKSQTKIQEIDIEKEIIAKSQQILHKLFKDNFKTCEIQKNDIDKLNELKLDKALVSYEKENETTLSSFMKDGAKRFFKMFNVSNRIALVGPICSGKSTLLNILGFIISKIQSKVLNYSVISPKNFTYGELYGSTDNIQAYSSDIELRNSIYSMILEKYAEMDSKDDEVVVKSIVIDAPLEEVDTECTIVDQMDLQKLKENGCDMNKNYIKFPNGITLGIPSDLYFLYETDTLKDVSPRFISSVGVVMTHEKFISWREMIKRQVNTMFEQNTSFYKMFGITQKSMLQDIEKIVVAIINKFESQYEELPLMWDKKSQVISFFNILSAYINEMKSTILRKVKKTPEYAKETIDYYNKSIHQTLSSFILISMIWSFSAASVDIGYKLNLVTSNRSENLSFFDLSFDFEQWHWVTVTDLDEYGLPFKIDKDNLIILTEDYLKYYNFISFTLSNSGNNDFGCIIVGDTSTFKTSILKSISYKYGCKKLWLPVSCYMTLPKLKSEIFNFSGGINKKHEDSIILIDDIHLQSNLNIDMLDYLRMWTKNRGHYNVQSKSFDSLGTLKTIMTFDLKRIFKVSKDRSIDISQNRFTYYCNSIYIPPIQRNPMRRILHGIISYRLDSLHDHFLSSFQTQILQSVMNIDEYMRKNVSNLKFSQFSNPNNIYNKKRLIEMILTRALDKEEDIESPKALAEVVMSLTNQIYLLRVLEPSVKIKMYEEISHIIMKEFRLDSAEVGPNGLKNKDTENLNKVVKEFNSRKGNQISSTNSIMSLNSLDECRRLLEQVECGVKYHMIVASEITPTESILKTTCDIGGYVYFPIFNSKRVSRYFDSYGFKAALQSAIKLHKKEVNKKILLYVSDAHHSDITYADLLNVIISYPEERCIFKEKSFIEKLCKTLKHLSGDNKENLKASKQTPDSEPSLLFETKVLEYLQNNLVIVIGITDLHNYYQWVSLYPNLEKICSIRFLNESLAPKDIINKSQQELVLNDQDKVIDACNYTEDFIKKFFTKQSNKNVDEENKVEPIVFQNEKVPFTIKRINPDSQKSTIRSKSVSQAPSEGVQIFKAIESINEYPKRSCITSEYFSECRFKSFYESFNTLYSKIKANLLKMKNFNHKYKERCQSIITLFHQKGLIKESYNCSSHVRQSLANAASVSERIEEMHAKIKEKEALVKLKEKIAKDASETK